MFSVAKAMFKMDLKAAFIILILSITIEKSYVFGCGGSGGGGRRTIKTSCYAAPAGIWGPQCR